MLDGDIVVAALVDGLDSKVVVALLGEIAGRGGGLLNRDKERAERTGSRQSCNSLKEVAVLGIR